MKQHARVGVVTLILCVIAGGVFAQPVGDVKILLPLVVEDPIPGAFGSLWVTRVTLLNTADRDISVDGFMQDTCQVGCGPFRLIPPGITFAPQFFPTSPEVEGYFLYTTNDDEPYANVQIHAQDLSRQSQTWGTELPAVSELEASKSRIDLVNIPIGEHFRSRLRVYDFDPAIGKNARVAYRVFAVREDLEYPWVGGGSNAPPVSTDVLLASGELTFAVATFGYEGRPGYTHLDLDSVPGLSGQSRVRIEVTPLTADVRFWAFVSVTNNETQHITTITPR